MSDNINSGALLASFMLSSALTVLGVSIDDGNKEDSYITANQAQATELIRTDVGSASKAFVSIYSSDKPIGDEVEFSPTVIRQYILKAEIPVQSEMQCITEGAAYIAQNSTLSSDFATIECAGKEPEPIHRYTCTIPDIPPFSKVDKSSLQIDCKRVLGVMANNNQGDGSPADVPEFS